MSLQVGIQPLDPAGFSFYGFGDGLPAVEQHVRRVGLRDSEPKVAVVEDGIFLPTPLSEGEGIALPPGLADREGRPVPEAAHRRNFREKIAVMPRNVLDEEVVYLGPLFGCHYGHFILESLARMWALEHVDPKLRVVFIPAGGAPGQPFPPNEAQRQTLEAFGVHRERIMVLNDPTRLHRVLVPEPLYELSRWAHRLAAVPYHSAAARVLECGGAGTSTQPVYLSRRLLPSAQRQAVGEFELEEVLRENGFLIAYPETMPFKEQVRLFNRNAHIFALDGTAAHGILFALGEQRLHLLTNVRPQWDYFLVSAVAAAQTSFIHCLGDGGRGTPNVSGRYFPQLLDQQPILAYLKERGFLKRRLRATLWAGRPEVSRRHEEAWLYARLRQVIESRRPTDALIRADEQAARRAAMKSWPLCLALALYYVRRGRGRIDGLVNRFSTLATEENDLYRVAFYAEDVKQMMGEVFRACPDDVAVRFRAVVVDRFCLDPCEAESTVERNKPLDIMGVREIPATVRGPLVANITDSAESRGPSRSFTEPIVPHSSRVYASRILETDYYSLPLRPDSVVQAERQEEIGWQARPDLEPWPIPEPIDWSANPFNDRNWFTQFHGWRPMDAYLCAYRTSGNPKHLSCVVSWMVSWPAFRDIAPEKEHRTLASLGGMRATRLAIVLDAQRAGAIALLPEGRHVLYQLARDDADWLSNPSNIALMNHAYFQVFGLELLSRILSDEAWAAKARAAAVETFERLIEAQFTPEGVHVENSPVYHGYALNQIERSGAINTFASAPARELVRRAKEVLPWLAFPDGQFADIGDSAGRGEMLSDAGENVTLLNGEAYAIAPFWRSGYSIVRSLPSVPVDQASMLLLVGTSMSHTHSHADKLSFELFEFGKRLIVDTGKYGYVRDPMRDYVESAVAHNTVGLATTAIRRIDVTLGATRLDEPRIEDGAFLLSGEVDWSTKWYAFTHRRELFYRPAEFLIIRDTLGSESPQQYASRLHFDRSLVLERIGRVLTTKVDSHTMRIELVDEDGELSVHRGQTDPVMGWQSVGYLQMEPTTMIQAVCHGKNRSITWLISFDQERDGIPANNSLSAREVAKGHEGLVSVDVTPLTDFATPAAVLPSLCNRDHATMPHAEPN